jgi:hypothetical protein
MSPQGPGAPMSAPQARYRSMAAQNPGMRPMGGIPQGGPGGPSGYGQNFSGQAGPPQARMQAPWMQPQGVAPQSSPAAGQGTSGMGAMQPGGGAAGVSGAMQQAQPAAGMGALQPGGNPAGVMGAMQPGAPMGANRMPPPWQQQTAPAPQAAPQRPMYQGMGMGQGQRAANSAPQAPGNPQTQQPNKQPQQNQMY